METKEKSTWGGARRSGKTQTSKPFRVDNDLLPALEELKEKGVNFNRFVNEAVREKLAKKA